MVLGFMHHLSLFTRVNPWSTRGFRDESRERFTCKLIPFRLTVINPMMNITLRKSIPVYDTEFDRKRGSVRLTFVSDTYLT